MGRHQHRCRTGLARLAGRGRAHLQPGSALAGWPGRPQRPQGPCRGGLAPQRVVATCAAGPPGAARAGARVRLCVQQQVPARWTHAVRLCAWLSKQQCGCAPLPCTLCHAIVHCRAGRIRHPAAAAQASTVLRKWAAGAKPCWSWHRQSLEGSQEPTCRGAWLLGASTVAAAAIAAASSSAAGRPSSGGCCCCTAAMGGVGSCCGAAAAAADAS